MTWFPIFGAGFFAGWWMCTATWPRGRDPDWRRSFNHENTNCTRSLPPLRFRHSPLKGTWYRWMHDLRPDLTREPFVYQPRPQQGTPNPPPSEP